MKKLFPVFLLIASLFMPGVFAAEEIAVLVDGEELVFDQSPIIRDDYTLVPFRAIFEKLGMTVSWVPEESSVIAENENTVISLKIGYDIMTLNGAETNIPTPPVIINSRTLVPLRAVSEAAGAAVDWNGETRTVIIDTKPKKTGRDQVSSYLEQNSNSEWAYEILRLTNAEREKNGLNPLKMDNTLSLLALMHCEDMIERGYFDHVNPEGEDPFDRMREFGISYWAAGENIAAGQESPEEAVKDWMNSTGHRENILNSKFQSLGIAVLNGGEYGVYMVQEFALLK